MLGTLEGLSPDHKTSLRPRTSRLNKTAQASFNAYFLRKSLSLLEISSLGSSGIGKNKYIYIHIHTYIHTYVSSLKIYL